MPSEIDADTADFDTRYDARILHTDSRAWFGAEGFYNVGWWDAGTPDQPAACRALVDRVIAELPAGSGPLVDVGCGLGATTARLAAALPGRRVTGVNTSEVQLAWARSRHRDLVFARMDAAELPLPASSVEALVSIEALLHVRTRRAFFDRAAEVLVPGGYLVVTDLLPGDPDCIGRWMLPAENNERDLDDYRASLESAGLEVTRLDDVTEHTWRAFCARRAAAEAEPLRAAFVDLGARGARHYLLVVARRR